MKKKLKDVKSGKTITGQPRDEIVLNPKQVTARFNEALTKHAVITFGRMNPPTIGHQLLADKLVTEARKVRGTPLIYLSHSQDSKKNPLQYEEKIKIAKAAFGQRTVVSSRARTIIEILKEVQRSYDSVTMVVGSDRINEFERILNTYNGRDFKFESVNVISSGQRDPDDQGVRGMSASKMRDLAEKNDAAGFKRGLPNSLKSMSDMILEMVRAGLKLNEELEAIEADDLQEGGVLTLASRRKKAISVRKHKAKLTVARARQRRKMADRGKIKKRSQRAAIRVIRKRIAGKKAGKYNKLSGAEKSAIDKRVRMRSGLVKKLATRLMPAVRRKEITRFKNKRTKKTKFRKNSMDYNFELYLAETYDFNIIIENYAQVTELVDKFLDHIQEQAQPARYRSDQDKNYVALEAKSSKTGISEATLIEMYEKGLTEWTDETSGTREQYAFQKVNTFIAKYQQVNEKVHNESWYQDQINGHHKGYNDHPEDQIAARKKAAAKKTAGKWLGAGNRKAKPVMSVAKEGTINELSKKTMGSYIKKASDDVEHNAYHSGGDSSDNYLNTHDIKNKKVDNRKKGIKTAVKKLVKVEEANKAFEDAMLAEIYWKVDIKGMPAVYVDKQGAGMIRAELRKVLKSPEKNIIGIERAQISDVKKYFRNAAKDPKKNQQANENIDTFMKSFFSDYEEIFEEKGRGPTGIAYTVSQGHPDAENPKTRKKHPERQTAEYKAKWKKTSKPGLGQYTEDAGAGEIGTPMLTKKYKLATPGQGNGVLTFAVAVDGVPHADGSGIGKPHLWNKS